MSKRIKLYLIKSSVFSLALLLLVFQSFYPGLISASTSPWSQTDWSGGDFTSSSNVTTSTANQITLTNTEKLSNTGFETDTTGWDTGGSFSDSTFSGNSSAVAAWPLDDTTTTQSYSRVVNPAVSTGRNIVINGGFDSDTTWTKGTGWTIAGGVASSNNTGGTGTVLYENIPITNGKAYSVTFTISNYVSGTARPYLGSGTAGTQRTANGTYTETLVAAGGASYVGILPYGGNLVADIDNVTVTQLNIPANTVTPTQLLTDGDMEASGTSSWTANGTLTKITSSPHGGTQSLRLTSSGSNVSLLQNVTTSGSVYRVSGYARSDGSVAPVLSNSSGNAQWTGTTSTSWQPFDVVYVADGTQAVKLRTTTTGYTDWDDVVVSLDTGIRSGELVQDGGLETWTTSTDLENWTEGLSGSSTINQETTVVHGGSSAIRFVVDSSNSFASIIQNNLSLGKTYTLTLWAKADTAGTSMLAVSGATNYLVQSLTTTYTQYSTTFVADSTSLSVKRNSATNRTIYVDDISLTEVDPLVGKPTNGVTLGSTSSGHLDNAYTFDGSNDAVNIYSSDFNSAFSPDEGTITAWAKVASSSVWSDSTNKYIFAFSVDANNFIGIRKRSTNNEVLMSSAAGGVGKTLSISTTTTSWFQVAITWSKSADQMKVYFNGSQQGSTLTGLGTWVGNLISTGVTIGAADTSGTSPWSGSINDVQLYNTALTSTQIAALYTSVARDTTTTYNSTSGSAKVISPTDENTTLTQSVNVGDTNSYNLVAYAYTTGAAVTSSDVSLYANGSTVSTTYTSVGSGWYKLTGAVTGVASSVGYGVQVKPGKTVYLDNMSLNEYVSSGTLTSSIFDSGQSTNWGVLTYSVTTPTNTTASVKVRTGNASDLSDATAFASCTAISSGATVGANSCAPNNTRYAQYQLSFSSSDLLNTPTFTNFGVDLNTSFVVNLRGPTNNEYTNNTRPTFYWNKLDTSSGVGRYTIEITNPTVNGVAGNKIVVDNIQPDRSTDVETSKYIIHYDTDNIYFYTKSSSNWADNEHDGELIDGTVNWKVIATDTAGNQTSATRALYVDTQKPSLEVDKASISKVSGTVSEEGSVIITYLKKGFNTQSSYDYGNYITTKSTTNSDGTFSWTTPDLPSGTYRLEVYASDNAGNTSDTFIKTLTNGIVVTPLVVIPSTEPSPTSTPVAKQTISPTNTPTSQASPISEAGPNIFQRIGSGISNVISGIATGIGTGMSSGAKVVGGVVSGGLRLAGNIAGGTLSLVGNVIGRGINIAYTGVSSVVAFLTNTTTTVFAFVGNSLNSITQGISHTYNSLAQETPGAIHSFLLAFGNIIHGTTQGISNIALSAWNTNKTIRNYNLAINQAVLLGVRSDVAILAFNVGEKAQDLSDSAGYAIVQFGYLFVNEPTTISNVKVVAVTPTSATISWTTNHPANGKVNYGLTEDYGQDTQSEKKVTFHEFTITNLKPNTTYYYEVMSHNKNYVYDAKHTFMTPNQ